MPRVARKLDTEDLEVAQAAPRVISSSEDGVVKLSPEEVKKDPGRVSIANRIDPEWVANMEFAKEKITIRVHESGDENEVKNVEMWNNGDLMVFKRGAETTCERRFVETLMRAKPIKYSQKATIDEIGKVGGYQEIPHTALRYHFSVVRDDNPNGPAWLKSILAQA